MSSNGQLPDSTNIREWVAALDRRHAEIQAEIEPLLREQAANREQRRLLTELLASYEEVSPEIPVPQRPTGGSVRERVRHQVRVVLEEAGGGPMHINDIHAEFQKRGFNIPGRGQPANITAHLSGEGDIVSPKRGVYGLESVVGPVAAKSRRKRRKTTKRRKGTTR